MTKEQVQFSLNKFSQDKLHMITTAAGRRILIQEKEDLNNLEFIHSESILVVKENLMGEIPVNIIYDYDDIDSLIFRTGEEWVDPMVINNKFVPTIRK